MAYDLSDDTKKKIDEFATADAHLKKFVSDFEADHMAELQYIEQLREARNAKLDDATRALRAEAERVPYTTTKRFSYGPFIAQKRISQFYQLDRFIAIANHLGLYKFLLDMGILKEETVMGVKFEEAKALLEEQGLADHFEECEDIRDAGVPAVTRPGSIVSFGAETKDK